MNKSFLPETQRNKAEDMERFDGWEQVSFPDADGWIKMTRYNGKGKKKDVAFVLKSGKVMLEGSVIRKALA